MHARRFTGYKNANFVKISISEPSALGLRFLKRSHPFFPIAPRRPPCPPVTPRPGVRMLSSRRCRVSRRASPFLSLSHLSTCAWILRLNSHTIIYILAWRHVTRLLWARWCIANSSLWLWGFGACFSWCSPAYRQGGAAFCGLLWARGRAFPRHWEALVGLARWAPRVSVVKTWWAVP